MTEAFASILGMAMITLGLIMLICSVGALMYAIWMGRKKQTSPAQSTDETAAAPQSRG